MPHIRSQLRPAIGNRLKDAVPALGGDVFWKYADPVFVALIDNIRPGKRFANIVFADERIVDGGSASGGPGLQYRDYDVDVTLFGVNDATIDDDLDALQVEVEAALARPSDLGVDVHSLTPKGSQLIEFGSNDYGELLGLRVRFTARVMTVTGSPDVSILKG